MALDESPGFRRRIKITPTSHWVRSEVEDDYHCMRVTIHHRDGIATAIEPVMVRAPWTTCPGAVEQLKNTFTGVALAEFAAHGEKRTNCTHLHDLATLGAAHALDREPLTYDILVSDPLDKGRREAELRCNEMTTLKWTHVSGCLTEPAELAGVTLDKLGLWISSLQPNMQEAARVFRWGTMIANGRTIPMEKQSDATQMRAGSCYTFQPHRIGQAQRIGEIRDFSSGAAQLLEECRAAS